jgi:predicted dehydrogenase
MNRREFLLATAATTTLASLPAVGRAANPAAPKLRTALIGCGWWGNNILREAMASGACSVVGLADVDDRALDATEKAVLAGTGDQPRRYRDYRALLQETRPEIAIVATPDHWHALPMIDSVKAGAHVYVEKPLGHTVLEEKAMVAAAVATGKVVQVGTHRRVSPHNLSARDFLRGGGAGEIGMVRCFVHYGGGPEQPRPTAPVPAGLDWDGWCGPAPVRPFSPGIHPRGFRHYLEYANGQLGDWGIHWLDQALWILGARDARTIFSAGGRPIAGAPVRTDAEQTTDAPDHQVATFAFDRFTLQWEHRRFGGNETDKGENVGCYFYGTKGIVHLGWREGWTFYPVDSRQAPQRTAAVLGQPDHQNIRELWSDFLAAIRTGARAACDIRDVQPASTLALLGMVSWRCGRSLDWDAAGWQVRGDPAANALLRRPYRSGWAYPVG